jgi:hypothetical protein
VSQGISYVLPVQKTKSSVEGVYQTNLRVMFQPPFLCDDPRSYNEAKLVDSLKYQFVSNRSSAPPQPQRQKLRLNAESEKVRESYQRTTPSTGGRTEVQQRSGIFLPIKAEVPPEAERLKKEVEQILKSVEAEADPGEEDEEGRKEQQQQQPEEQRRPVRVSRVSRQESIEERRGEVSRGSRDEKERSAEGDVMKKASLFGSYEALKSATVPARYEVPEALIPPYMSEAKANDIWQWLHKGEAPTEFKQFLDVCS